MRYWMQMLSVCLIGAVAAGCVAIGAAMYKASGDPKKPADYKLGKDQPTLVMVESYANPDLYEVQSERLENDIVHQLKENKAGTIIDPQRLNDLRVGSYEAFGKMNTPQVGRKVGAAKVIYVNLMEFKSEAPVGSDVSRGVVRAMVKVVDVQSGRTLWPADSSAGKEIKFETPDIHDLESDATPTEKLYTKLTDKIATLFYDAPQDMVDGTEPQ